LSDYAPIVTGRSGIIDLVEPDDSTASIILPGVESDARTREVAELINAYWDDNELYCKTFFPKTCRQESAPFHARMDHALWSRRRKVAIKVFRAGAKTTRVRIFLSKRIAYGVSRTILYISKSEGTALATVDWLKRLVETQSPWAVFWGIQKGKVWAADEAEFVNTILNVSVVIKAVGIHGQIRGLNFDDYRPDLIVCDDIEDEKTVNTDDQIKKHSDLLHGTVMRSLASPIDNPDAMIVIIQTPLNMNDAVETAFAAAGPDPLSDWYCVEASCFETDPETGELRSAWPALFPLEFLLGEKQAAINANKLSVWLREMEVTVTSPEACSFKLEWLQLHDSLPSQSWDELILTIDPASSERKTADFQAVVLSGKMGGHGWLCGYNIARGQDIEDSVTKFFETWDLMLVLGTRNGKRANLRFAVEITGYQRQLKRAIEKEMRARKRYAHIEPIQDKRNKEDVINQSFTHVAPHGVYHCLKTHSAFISDFARYPQVPHDDLIEAAARGLDMMDLTGKANSVATGGVERIAANKGLIIRHAQRLITSRRGSSLGRHQ
jgi:hypothetical protein